MIFLDKLTTNFNLQWKSCWSTQAAAAPAATSGKVSQVIGAVVDVGGTQGNEAGMLDVGVRCCRGTELKMFEDTLSNDFFHFKL